MVRPIRARKPLPQVGQRWVGAVCAVADDGFDSPCLAGLLCCLGPFFPSTVFARSCVDMVMRQDGRSAANI